MNVERIIDIPGLSPAPNHADESIRSIARAAKGSFDDVRNVFFQDKLDRCLLLSEWLYNETLSIRNYRVSRGGLGRRSTQITFTMSSISVFSGEELSCFSELSGSAERLSLIAVDNGIEFTLDYL